MAKAAVQDADEPVAEGSEGLVVGRAAGSVGVTLGREHRSPLDALDTALILHLAAADMQRESGHPDRAPTLTLAR